jgi:hypothetical protein
MPQLSDIPGIDEKSIVLLDMAGIRDIRHLANQKAAGLRDEIKKANQVLSIVEEPPGENTIQEWIGHAAKTLEDIEPVPEQPLAVAPPVNYEGNEQVAEMMGAAPCAIPLPGKLLKENKLRVGDIPAGILLNRYSGDLDVRVDDVRMENPEAHRIHVPTLRPTTKERGVTQTQKRGFDTSQIKAISPEYVSKQKLPGSKNVHVDDRVALIRTPRESTNRGRNPASRRYIRGVLHTHPWSLRIGAFFSLLLILILPLAIISAFLLLLSRQNPDNFEWVPKWILAFPISLPVIGIAYLLWGISGKCRICTQQLFLHKGALKHVKSHRIRGLGYVAPLCLHLLLFNWFRCSSCGTPVRLRK